MPLPTRSPLQPTGGRTIARMARKRPEKNRQRCWPRELPVSVALCALELPGRIAPGVEVVRVSSPRGGVTRLKLSRQFHLIRSQPLTAQRARPAKSRSAQRAVRSLRRQRSGADRFSCLLPEERLVGHRSSTWLARGSRHGSRQMPRGSRENPLDGA